MGLVRILARACVEQGLVNDDSRGGFLLLAVSFCQLGMAACKHPLYKGGLKRLLCQLPYHPFFELGSRAALLQLLFAVKQPSAEVQRVLDLTWWDGRPPISQPSSGGVAKKKGRKATNKALLSKTSSIGTPLTNGSSQSHSGWLPIPQPAATASASQFADVQRPDPAESRTRGADSIPGTHSSCQVHLSLLIAFMHVDTACCPDAAMP